ncbi:lantibiotic dehydratase [Streptomyces marincola]|uniref:lantibiotic dehydratase n=1 Tax=Streptomyces marincola TaxID=2878388 RepID=UPI001CF3076E|nr:lantibiotic dehydratase [Streptomyces marincola]UCM88935.1 lantibiotic dehydratase [Streptomyces marincola]
MYHAVDAALIRTAAHPLAAEPPSWPDVDGDSAADVHRWRKWMGRIWSDDTTAAAIEVASPRLAEAVRGVLAGHIQRPRTVRRAVVSLVRYLLRMRHRATPFGLFAGAAPLRLGDTVEVRWGTRHRVTARADAKWLNDAVTALETTPGLLRLLPVMADPTRVIRGTKVVVPHQPGVDGPVEVVLRRTPAVETVLDLARTPITVADIVDKLRADYPDTPTTVIEDMLRHLVAHRVLLTSLRAPMTTDDALGHVVSQLIALGADAIPEAASTIGQLHGIHRRLTRHDAAPADEQRTIRAEATQRMTAVTGATDRVLAVNLRPDCDIALPTEVAREAERALKVMAGISPFPNGPVAWQDYRARFLERYSMGALVPLRDLTDPDIGLGFPAGYRDSALSRPVLATTRRDEHLLALAQDAAVNGVREVVLAEEDFAALAVGDVSQVPAHVELCFTVLATSQAALQQGRFKLSLAGLSLAAGTTTGRFLATLEDADRQRALAAYAVLPTLDAGADRAQVSSPPLRLRTQNVSRAPAVVPHLLSLGEHNPAATLHLDDLAVGADSQRLYLVSLATGRRVEPSVLNAVELTNATHPLVRFVTEVHRSHVAVLAPFAWGAAARLPFLPEIRVGRTILSPACWRLKKRDLGAHDGTGWIRRLMDWRCRYGVPRTVFVGSDDQRLRLDLDDPTHLRMLHIEVERTDTVTVHEAPEEDAYGWLGRAHEITMPFASTLPPATPLPFHGTVVRRHSGRLPGTSPWAYLKLYSHPERAAEILTTHLPTLFEQWEDGAPPWWFTRYSDSGTHLRLRLKLPGPHAFGDTAQRVGTWAAVLRDDGLISRVQWDTDEPETGRYGTGHVLDAAEHFFAADSAAATAQLALVIQADLRPAVTAASFVDIAAAFTGNPATGHRWLVENLLKSEGTAPARDLQHRAIHLSAPDTDLATLHSLPGGDRVAATWARRRTALEQYRTALTHEGNADPLAVLPSLLHMHHNRAAGIDPDGEATCRRLARTAALSWTARHQGAPR